MLVPLLIWKIQNVFPLDELHALDYPRNYPNGHHRPGEGRAAIRRAQPDPRFSNEPFGEKMWVRYFID